MCNVSFGGRVPVPFLNCFFVSTALTHEWILFPVKAERYEAEYFSVTAPHRQRCRGFSTVGVELVFKVAWGLLFFARGVLGMKLWGAELHFVVSVCFQWMWPNFEWLSVFCPSVKVFEVCVFFFFFAATQPFPFWTYYTCIYASSKTIFIWNLLTKRI